MSVRRLAPRVGAALVLVLGLSQLIRPARTNPPTDPERTLAAREQPPSEIAGMLDRSCRDCHTGSTTWPWYTNVAPISWWIIDHVNEGRRRVSFADWAALDAAHRVKELNDICRRVERHDMPLESYLLVHHDAELSESERRAICEWTGSAAAHEPAR